MPIAPGDPFWMHYGFYDYYWRAWPYVYSPSYLERVRLVALELRLFGGSSADGRLVFRATSDEFELADASRAVDSVAADFAKHLADAGLVPRGSRAEVSREHAQLAAAAASGGAHPSNSRLTTSSTERASAGASASNMPTVWTGSPIR